MSKKIATCILVATHYTAVKAKCQFYAEYYGGIEEELFALKTLEAYVFNHIAHVCYTGSNIGQHVLDFRSFEPKKGSDKATWYEVPPVRIDLDYIRSASLQALYNDLAEKSCFDVGFQGDSYHWKVDATSFPDVIDLPHEAAMQVLRARSDLIERVGKRLRSEDFEVNPPLLYQFLFECTFASRLTLDWFAAMFKIVSENEEPPSHRGVNHWFDIWIRT